MLSFLIYLMSFMGLSTVANALTNSQGTDDATAASEDAFVTLDAEDEVDVKLARADPMGEMNAPMDITNDVHMAHTAMDPADDHSEMEMDDTAHHHAKMAPVLTSAAEIDAFVMHLRMMGETHAHGDHAGMMAEHMAVLDLVPRDEATHIAVGHGDWNDPANWHNGEVPSDGARVLIPEGIHMTYGQVNEESLFTLRVDGALEFASDTDSQLVVDTFVVSPTGVLTIGSEKNPVDPDVNVDIIFANNGEIDVDWDPTLLSRGLIAHGTVNIHGAEKSAHEKVVDDPQAGDTFVDFGTDPAGWAIGDTIVIAGTHYDGYDSIWFPEDGYTPSEDETRVITKIEDGKVHFDDPLIHDHDTPRDDLKTSVANYTRNVSFETEDAETAEVYERGHVMFVHNDDVDVRYAEFHELGRTDKSQDALNASEFEDIAFDSNVKGRYSFHFHKAGADSDDPGIAIGNSVFGSPGWGFVHHDSHAVLDGNATFDTFGAGFVAESGNETGAWTNNIAIFAQGVDWRPAKFSNDVETFDMGRTGDGFWFQGRMVESNDNIAASVNHGFVYFHRGKFDADETSNIKFDSETTNIESVLHSSQSVLGDQVPILEFSGNETFAAKAGLEVVKGNPNQGHDVHSVLENFTAWNVIEGAHLEYTSHYVLTGFDIIGRDPSENSPEDSIGIHFGNNVTDMSVVDAQIANFKTGIDLSKDLLGQDVSLNQYSIVNPTFIGVENEYASFDPSLDEIVSSSDLSTQTPDLVLDHTLTYKDGNFHEDPSVGVISISGTKTDSLGEIPFPAGTDNYDIGREEVIQLVHTNGFYTTSDGQDFFMLDLHFSDRVTGDIFVEKHPVLLDDNVMAEPRFRGATFNGTRDLDGENDPTMDDAALWATITKGQLVLSEVAPTGLDEEEPELTDM